METRTLERCNVCGFFKREGGVSYKVVDKTLPSGPCSYVLNIYSQLPDEVRQEFKFNGTYNDLNQDFVKRNELIDYMENRKLVNTSLIEITKLNEYIRHVKYWK